MPSTSICIRIGGIPSAYHIEHCMECGTCTYVCPAHIPLTWQIRMGKQYLEKEEKE